MAEAEHSRCDLIMELNVNGLAFDRIHHNSQRSYIEATSMIDDVGVADDVDEGMLDECIGASESMARITHVDALLSVVTRK